MKHIQNFENFLNEANGLAYWSDYAEDTSNQAEAWMSEPCTDMSHVLKCIDKSIDAWNAKAEEDGGDRVTKASERHIGDLAIRYWKQFKTINGNIVTAMIMQES